MDFYGEINLKQNAMQQMVVQTETNFPETPVVGRVVFKDAKLYMCVAINNLIPVWLPLTNKIDTYVHSEAVASTTWTVNHGMNTTIPLIQVYDEEGEMLIPESAIPLDNNNMTITFNVAVAGTAIVLFGDLIPQSGVGLLEPSSPFAVSLLFTLDNPNAFGTVDADRYGNQAAITDNYAVVSTTHEDDASGTSSGKVYIYNPTTGVLLNTIDNPNDFGTSTNDDFGWNVSLTDTYLGVSARTEGDAGGNGSGKVYIFNTSTGALLNTIQNPNAFGTSGSDQFGISLRITDTYTVSSASNEDDVGGLQSGKVYIFNTVTGALLNTLDNPNPVGTVVNDSFGNSLDVTDNFLAVAAYQEDDAGSASGKVYIYNTSTGALLNTLDNPNDSGATTDDTFGGAVAITDTHTIVGATGEDVGGDSGSGIVYAFNTATGALLYTIYNPNVYGTPVGDGFGRRVTVNDSYVVVGASFEDDATGSSSGAVYVFDVADGSLLWSLANPNPFGTGQFDGFGDTVELSDTQMIIGAKGEDTSVENEFSGKAYIYDIG